MRAFHMPSLPEMPYEHVQENNMGQVTKMKLKVLYTLDDNTFLARSNNLSDVKTARIPIPGQSAMMTLGVVSMRSVLIPILHSSPELFGDTSIDYSVYVKDISEEDEPFVGHGLFTNLISQNFNQFDDDVLIPGRVCSNFAALLSNRGGSSETLEIKLRLARVKSNRPQNPQHEQQQEQTQQQHQTQHQSPIPATQQIAIQRPESKADKISRHESDTEEETEEFRQPKKIRPQQKGRKRVPSTTFVPTRITNSNPAPKAVRTQSLPAFNNPLNQVNLPNSSIPAIIPGYSIAHRIREADKSNSGKTTYGFHVEGIDEKSNAPIDISTEVSKRFADGFIKTDKKKQPSKKNNNSIPKSQPSPQISKPHQPLPIAPAPKKDALPQLVPMSTTPASKVAPSCMNCKITESTAWRWNESDEEYKRGLFCNNCYIYLIDKGVMRPSYLFKKRSRNQKKKPISAAITTAPSSSAASTPSAAKVATKQRKNNNNSSDPIDEFNEIISSDLDFTFDPMTDIDPLPQQLQNHLNHLQSEDKENIPPQSSTSQAIPLKKASRQNSFEKMLAKSFSGAPPNMANTPIEWMSEFFEPTPRDQEDNTPKDFENNTPKDLATCNTIPCEDESPQPSSEPDQSKQQDEQQQHQQQPTTNPPSDEFNENRNLNKIKATTMPSSPFALQIGDTSSPNSMHDNSDWLSEHTRLSSIDNEHHSTTTAKKVSNGEQQQQPLTATDEGNSKTQ